MSIPDMITLYLYYKLQTDKPNVFNRGQRAVRGSMKQWRFSIIRFFFGLERLYTS